MWQCSVFGQTSIIKAIHAVLPGEYLSACPCRDAPAIRKRDRLHIVMCGKEGCDLIAVLFRQYRAGDIQQLTPRREQRPERSQQTSLQICRHTDVLWPTSQLDIRMATYDAGGAAGRIQQDAFKATPVPPGLGLSSVRPLQGRL